MAPQSQPAQPAAHAATAEPGINASSGLPEWAHDQVVKGGGSPTDYTVHQGMLMKRLGQDHASGQPGSMPEGPMPQPSFSTPTIADPFVPAPPVASPRIGVPARPRVGAIGVNRQPQGDPVREALMRRFQDANWSAEHEDDMVDAGGGNYVRNTTMPAHANMMALASAIGQHDSTLAGIRASDPMSPAKLMQQYTDNPRLGQFYLASKGADPSAMATIGGPTQPGEPEVNAQNYPAFLKNSNPVLNATLGSTESTLLQKLQEARNHIGISDPSQPNHQALQSWINHQYADPRQWAEETYVPPNPDNGIPEAYSRPLGVAAAALHSIFGPPDSHSLGTGMNWRTNYRERTEQAELLRRLGIMNPADIPAATIQGGSRPREY